VSKESLSRRGFLRAASAAILASGTRAQRSQPPNFVLILCDDLGYGDIHAYGSSIPTPNLDRMADEGIRFRQFYAASSVCSPSRAALLTGRYPTRVRVPTVLFADSPDGLPLDEVTIAEMLKPVGYSTMCIGKWHLGTKPQYLPTSRGFDEYYGIPYSNDISPSILLHNTDTIESPVQLDTLTQRYTQQATEFIKRSKSRPFFLYLAHTFPHIPLAASPAFKGKSRQGLYGDTVEEIDWSVGQVLQVLNDTGVDSNTLVIFTSDNGPWFQGSPGRLRGRKGSTYEGGVREPFIARFPGRIPSGTTRTRDPRARMSNAIATTMDLLPTMAALCNAPLPSKPLDGVDIWPILSGQREDVSREAFLYFDYWNLQCARIGDWKLHVARYNNFPFAPEPKAGSFNLPLPHPELYNLENDPDESFDVAAGNPETVASIQARIQQLLPTFPQEVTMAWKTTMGMRSVGEDGGLPERLP
jgi:arylsulfatase A